MIDYTHEQRAGAVIARLRADAGITQAVLAKKSGLDQSRISRIEKGEVTARTDLDAVLEALLSLGVTLAGSFREFVRHDWLHVEPPSFWNPERACLEITDETLAEIAGFLEKDDCPWPLRRQIERQRDLLTRAASFLGKLNHSVAFIGDMGVGKSTAISVIFDLLTPPSLADKVINRPVLETGGGGTTICEVHIKGGPEFGISLLPMADAEVRELVSDFCSANWAPHGAEQRDRGEIVNVSREAQRAIRNMSGLTRKYETVDGKTVHNDPIGELSKSSSSEDEFRTRLLSLMKLDERTRREIWYDSSTRKNPMEWVSETFKAVNNGRMSDVPLPKSIDLIIPNFGLSFGELEITVIDTKGVHDVAVREDLDHRLKDPRTAVVFCSRFNDAPGTSTRVLLQHMRQTFSERFDTGKVSILALPRSAEARAMKDDMGEEAQSDAEGYEFKGIQVSSELSAEGLAGVPMLFFNVEADAPGVIRSDLFGQLVRMRKAVEERLFDLCAASQDIIKNHEAHALNTAIEEVTERLKTFLGSNRELGAREQLAHVEAIRTVRSVRYASTLWAATRRSGMYSGLNVVYLVGVGAARDAKLRSEAWMNAFDAFVKFLKADQGLTPAQRTIDQIAVSAATSRRSFLEAVQLAGVEVYREALSQSSVWTDCASEWGRGKGFKDRVVNHLENWFMKEAKLKDRLEQTINSVWERQVIAPLMRLVEENAPETDSVGANVVHFRSRKLA